MPRVDSCTEQGRLCPCRVGLGRPVVSPGGRWVAGIVIRMLLMIVRKPDGWKGMLTTKVQRAKANNRSLFRIGILVTSKVPQARDLGYCMSLASCMCARSLTFLFPGVVRP